MTCNNCKICGIIRWAALLIFAALIAVCVLSGAVNAADCTLQHMQDVNTQVNHEYKQNGKLMGMQDALDNLGIDAARGEINCTQAAALKHALLSECKTKLIFGHLPNGMGHTILRGYATDKSRWVTLDSRPGTDKAIYKLRDFLPEEKWKL